jgi:hypothetical protein
MAPLQHHAKDVEHLGIIVDDEQSTQAAPPRAMRPDEQPEDFGLRIRVSRPLTRISRRRNRA